MFSASRCTRLWPNFRRAPSRVRRPAAALGGVSQPLYNRAMTVRLGSDRLLDSHDLDGRRVASSATRRRLTASSGTSSIGWRQHPRARLAAHLRPAARVPIRRAGKHDRDRPLARRRPARADLLALQRDARADRGHAARSRRPRDRSAGRRHAHLHLHLHDGQLSASPRARTASRSSCAIGPIRSAASPSRDRCSSTDSSRSSASIRSRCGTA